MQYNVFPEFVANQLLTYDYLNQVFDYLDEQERMTRACLVGIGIVCGLEVSAAVDGSSLTISCGCGVTSEGYLVSVPAKTYTQSIPYNAVQPIYYAPFVDEATKTQKFSLLELAETATVANGTPLTNAVLAQYNIVLLFVELLEQRAQNCDPNTCVDKGVEVTVTIRALLASSANVKNTLQAAGAAKGPTGGSVLPAMRLPRVDVPATPLAGTPAVLYAFFAPLFDFIPKLSSALKNAFKTLAPLAGADFSLAAATAAVNRWLEQMALGPKNAINAQYYYDWVGDLVAGYEELRRVGECISGVCCPDLTLFPRHLLLGEATGISTGARSDYRDYFIPSPISAQNCCCGGEVRCLLFRLYLLLAEFAPPARAGQQQDLDIRITPSRLGDVPLSRKSIPYYYRVTDTTATSAGSTPLYEFWNCRTDNDTAPADILSFRADQYIRKAQGANDPVLHPLLYDLEPYNFLRVEGHLGHAYQSCLANLQDQKAEFRLPVNFIALSTGELAASTETADATGAPRCFFQDLEALYESWKARAVCFLSGEMKLLCRPAVANRAGGGGSQARRNGANGPAAASNRSNLSLQQRDGRACV